MAITQALATSFKVDLLANTLNNGDVYKCALYTSSASLDADTTVYTATNEVTGTGYTAGGATLTIAAATSTGSTAYADITDATWPASTITGARAALIYNSTTGNAAVAVLDFGSDKSSSASTFTIVFPTADSTNAIIRIS